LDNKLREKASMEEENEREKGGVWELKEIKERS